MAHFEIIDHAADIGLAAWGETFEEALAGLAEGMFSIMADLGTIEERLCRKVKVESPDQESLVVDWLNELLYIADIERLVFCRFEITGLAGCGLLAECHGERIDPAKHRLGPAVKAATYHMLAVERGDCYRIKVILDI
ncbi:MAG: archease [Dehalococcoidia bacterium]|nr:archease [Dehalococcoidia bacterium]